MAEARSENTLISEGAAQSLINKPSPRGGAEIDLGNNTAGRGTKIRLLAVPRGKV
jgi:hypothetical protein